MCISDAHVQVLTSVSTFFGCAPSSGFYGRKGPYNLQPYRKWHYNLQFTVNGTTIYNYNVKPHDNLKVQKALLKSMPCVTDSTTFKIPHVIKAVI